MAYTDFHTYFLIINPALSFAINKGTVALRWLRQFLLSSRIKRVFIHFLFFEAQKPLIMSSLVKKKEKKPSRSWYGYQPKAGEKKSKKKQSNNQSIS
jgi:hypothetical protein